jgi:hypothetical protein
LDVTYNYLYVSFVKMLLKDWPYFTLYFVCQSVCTSKFLQLCNVNNVFWSAYQWRISLWTCSRGYRCGGEWLAAIVICVAAFASSAYACCTVVRWSYKCFTWKLCNGFFLFLQDPGVQYFLMFLQFQWTKWNSVQST